MCQRSKYLRLVLNGLFSVALILLVSHLLAVIDLNVKKEGVRLVRVFYEGREKIL